FIGREQSGSGTGLGRAYLSPFRRCLSRYGAGATTSRDSGVDGLAKRRRWLRTEIATCRQGGLSLAPTMDASSASGQPEGNTGPARRRYGARRGSKWVGAGVWPSPCPIGDFLARPARL